jgi:hypothetical protein
MAQEIVAPGRGAGRTTRSSASRLTVRALLFAVGLGTDDEMRGFVRAPEGKVL